MDEFKINRFDDHESSARLHTKGQKSDISQFAT